MARVDSFDRVIEIDLDLDNSNVEMNNSNNSPPSSSHPSESGYELEEDNFSSDDSDNDFYEIETDSDEEELPTYRKFGKKKMNKDDYIEHIANYLVDIGLPTITVPPKKSFHTSSASRLIERHFPKHLPKKKGKIQALLCKACNFTTLQLCKMGYPPERLPRKTSVYWCEECESPLCITPCFELFHTYSDFRQKSLLVRCPNI